ncbi:hypothetical protein Y88_0633 [Novosphingobium nitrogenifigens DSM 19370]|uniref:DUF488 domain-containing protein n=1 Tax=Novosphingobium nitrogenifigens DSM 19370 TaxID=983920 RepID=F1ZA16_9SPHN|nr:DUF488 domain-containing protein [Novosphingobium nitrogenifigens]EGD58576.1 hypothetical protein Y88_0633 [Novosphingobium nitrogenifigens DSM 19370]
MERPTIWTIGYEQTTMGDFLAALTAAGVEVVADVRALPLSRRPGFSKSTLAASLADAGIGYAHFRALGTPSEGRAAARRHDHATLERIYAGQLELPEAMVAMAALADLAREKRTCLLCFERAADGCHRTLLREVALPGFEAVDLVP